MQATSADRAIAQDSQFSAEGPTWQFNLVFDQTYHAGQELGVFVGDEIFSYRVADADVHCDNAETQCRVARGVLAALVNGGFTGFPRHGATLAGNTLTLLRSDRPAIPCDDIVWARSLWSN